jgi:hypothetical protein
VTTSTDTAGIPATGRHTWLAWLLYFTKLTIETDGQKSVGPWGRRFVDAPPGRHQVRVFFKYVTKPRCGDAAVMVELAAGQRIDVEYRAPHLMSSPGKIRIVS